MNIPWATSDAACTGPDDQPQKAATPTNWSSELQGGLTGNAADTNLLDRWWTVFNDPVLSDLVKRARAGNLDLRTCMNILGCLDTPTGGEYRFQGIEVGTLNRNPDEQIVAALRAQLDWTHFRMIIPVSSGCIFLLMLMLLLLLLLREIRSLSMITIKRGRDGFGLAGCVSIWFVLRHTVER